jgi:hypothetical protein
MAVVTLELILPPIPDPPEPVTDEGRVAAPSSGADPLRPLVTPALLRADETTCCTEDGVATDRGCVAAVGAGFADMEPPAAGAADAEPERMVRTALAAASTSGWTAAPPEGRWASDAAGLTGEPPTVAGVPGTRSVRACAAPAATSATRSATTADRPRLIAVRRVDAAPSRERMPFSNSVPTPKKVPRGAAHDPS